MDKNFTVFNPRIAELESELAATKADLREAMHRLERSSLASHAAALKLAGLTARQREIMHCVLAGQPSKNIAADLGISQRTVENHRASIMQRTGAKSIPGLARLAVGAA